MTEILGQFRDEDLPPSRVDIHRAVQSGRRRRRIRTVVAASSAALAVAVGALTAPAWLFPQSAPVPPGETPCGDPASTRSATPTRQPFDPLVAEIDASGVTDHRVVTVSTSTYWQRMQLAGDDWIATVTLFACGGPYALNSSGQPTPIDPTQGEPADLVGGESAYWLPQSRRSDPVALAWQWSPGAWAVVMPSEPDLIGPAPERDELRAIATQIAGGLRIGVRAPVTSPISLPTPDGMYPVFTAVLFDDLPAGRADADGSAPPSVFVIGFHRLDDVAPAYPFVVNEIPGLLITVNRLSTGIDSLPDDLTPYPEDLGYPAYQATSIDGNPDLVSLTVYEFFGFAVEIAPSNMPGASSTDEKLSRAADVFRTITVYPDAATDPTVWADPITP